MEVLTINIYNMKSGIYRIVCVENGRFYIGSSRNIQKRWTRHLNDLRNRRHGNDHLQRSFDKYGENRFVFEVIEECDVDNLFLREQFYLDTLNPYGEVGFNIGRKALGGDNLTNHPNREDIIDRIKKGCRETLSKMTEEERKVKWSKAGHLNPNWGNKWSDESRIKSSNTCKKLYADGKMVSYKKGKTHIDLYGEKMAKEFSENLSYHASQRIGDRNNFYGKSHTDETKQKMREFRIGIKPANRVKIKINGIVYDSYYDAFMKLGIPVVTIRWRCLSKNPKFDEYQLI